MDEVEQKGSAARTAWIGRLLIERGLLRQALGRIETAIGREFLELAADGGYLVVGMPARPKLTWRDHLTWPLVSAALGSVLLCLGVYALFNGHQDGLLLVPLGAFFYFVAIAKKGRGAEGKSVERLLQRYAPAPRLGKGPLAAEAPPAQAEGTGARAPVPVDPPLPGRDPGSDPAPPKGAYRREDVWGW